MRLSKFSKKWIAYFCAIAMVVAGLAFVPGTDDVMAAPDYSGLTYSAIGNNTHTEVAASLQGSEIAVAEGTVNMNVKQYQNAGMKELYLALAGNVPTAATINGNSSAINMMGDQIFIGDAADYLTYEYNVLDVTFSSGSAKIIIHCPAITDGGTYDPEETTTPDPAIPTTTADPWKSVGGSAQYFYNNNTKTNISQVVNIQKPGFADEEGIYMTVPAGISTVSVNGVTENVAAIQGAGTVVYLSALSKYENEVVITQGAGTSTIQIRNTEGTKDDPTEAPTDVTEAPTEAPTDVTEAPTEAPTEETEAPTEAPTEETEAPTEAPTEQTEAPTEEPTTEGPATEWTSVKGLWGLRKADGSFDTVADGGANYNDFTGIASFYSSGDGWAGADADVKAPSPDDPNKLDIRVNALGNGQAWSLQTHVNLAGLDATKVYDVVLYAGDTAVFTDAVSESATYQKTIDLAGKLSLGETTLEIKATEADPGPAPEVKEITITPDTEKIAANSNIWASWTNPEGTTKAYCYLGQADDDHSAATLNNGWIFNYNATQPMTAVDNVAQTKDATIKVAMGKTYTFIVKSYDKFGRLTGEGSVDIEIPSGPVGGDVNFTTAERRDVEIGGTTYYAVFANWDKVPGAAGYKSYIDTEDDNHKARATNNGWIWSDQNQPAGSTDTHVDNVGTTKDMTVLDSSKTYTLIVVANDAEGNEIGRGSVELKGKETPTESPSGETESPSVEPSSEAPTEEPSTEAPTVEPSTEAPTVEPSTEAPTVEPSTEAPTQEPTTQAPTQKPTQAPTVAPTVPKPVPVIKIPDKAKVKKAVKKKSAKKIKVKIKKVKGAKGYQVYVSKKKKGKALVKKYVKKTKFTIKSKKFKKKKKLYVKVRAYVLDGTTKVFGAWSKPKKTKKK